MEAASTSGAPVSIRAVSSSCRFRSTCPCLPSRTRPLRPALLWQRAHCGSWWLTTTTTAAQMLTYLLTREGHVVEAAEDGERALEKAIAFAPDVAIFDI